MENIKYQKLGELSPILIKTNHENIEWGGFSLIEFAVSEKENINKIFNTCLDIGSGKGEHSRVLSSLGLEVYQVDKYSKTAQFQNDYLETNFNDKFDIIFCSHVIEHQRNVGLFLDKIYDDLADHGFLIISAPKHPAERFVEGHLNSFIFPYFLQHLIHAGFDCKKGKFLSMGGHENAFIVRKSSGFSYFERKEQGFQWLDEHRERSFHELITGSTIDNGAFFLNNCNALKLDPKSKPCIKISFPDNYSPYGIEINIPRAEVGFRI